MSKAIEAAAEAVSALRNDPTARMTNHDLASTAIRAFLEAAAEDEDVALHVGAQCGLGIMGNLGVEESGRAAILSLKAMVET